MALSVLKIPTKKHGLWDSLTNDFILQGSEDDCYTEKNRLETIEQNAANAEWKSKLFASQMELLTKAGLTERHARKIVEQNLLTT